ncbi:MBL fold metallo-hydrolase [Mucilaginibacter sp. HMF5004]|uniref:rhodanese-like domain-containing protein n=1 Tax=Mucilaginibacter rivuli TaxID=2857527 RepID=UPI001C5EF329|nr:rhodanese-like domain-containing protein [Mucilaginibacter rivuli]MBW4891439.1 MBL fold metallo-hydrolase [Mucilaginibacter rivuli]
MIIHQFYDKGLAHASYAIISQGKMVVIDPARDPQPYYDLATEHGAQLVGVIETHPHADFVSSHLEIHQQTGATIFVSRLLGANYAHKSFDDGDTMELGDLTLKAINTPGHSPDSICILVEDEFGQAKAIFTGDTLFVGDVGRPDLRESVGNLTAKKEELARAMYHSTREKLMKLPESVVVYPAHGPGSLCGKNMSPDLNSTIGRELRENYALQLMTELQFVKTLTDDQPFIPKYFGYDVDLNKQGASSFEESIAKVPRLNKNETLENGVLVIDARPQAQFKAGHVKGAINIQNGDKFETWLGSIISPTEQFYLIGEDEATLDILIRKAAKIGYEQNIKGTLLAPDALPEQSSLADIAAITNNSKNYTIIDVRNVGEAEGLTHFPNAINIPLPELRERLSEIPTDKPIVVHCAAGYRSAVGSSIISAILPNAQVYDFGEAITTTQPSS